MIPYEDHAAYVRSTRFKVTGTINLDSSSRRPQHEQMGTSSRPKYILNGDMDSLASARATDDASDA